MIVLLAALAGCACTPGGLTLTDQTPDTSDPATTDTSPAPPCPFPEEEPNNRPDESTPMAIEQRMCGALSEGDAVDVFGVELDDDGWIEVEVEGDEGSVMQPQWFFQGASLALQASSSVSRPDAMRRFEVPAGTYSLAISDREAGSGERFTYRALVSEIKAPVVFDVEESEPNDEWREAQVLTDDEAVFGFMDDADDPDQDWYRISVPVGRHDVIVDVDAMDAGSGANLVVELFDETLASVRRIEGGEIPATFPDPEGQYGSSGDEVLFLQVTQQGTSPIGGIDRWYRLAVGLEAR